MVKVKNKWGLEEFGMSDKEFERQFREAIRRGKEELKFSPKAVRASAEKGIGYGKTVNRLEPLHSTRALTNISRSLPTSRSPRSSR